MQLGKLTLLLNCGHTEYNKHNERKSVGNYMWENHTQVS